MSREKRYKCKICGEFYHMTAEDYQKRSKFSNGRLSRTCTNKDCEIESTTRAAMKIVKRERILKKKNWKEEKARRYKELGIEKRDPLVVSCQKIARLIDEDQPCLARPTEFHKSFDGGHIFGKGAHPAFKYHLWNIHKQGKYSNMNQKDDALMQEGFVIRYGEEKFEWLKDQLLKHSVLKLTKPEKKEKLKIANGIIREMEKGKKYSRDEVNEKLGIYKDS